MGQHRRILFVLEYFHPHQGGVETLFLQLTEALAARGYQVAVITLRLPGTERHEVHHGVEIHRVGAPRWARRYWFTLLAVPAVFRRAAVADLVHTTTYNAAIPAWLGAAARGKPAVVTVHEVFGDQWNQLRGLHPRLGFFFRLFEWVVLHLPFARFVCVSRFTRERLRQFMRVPAGRAAVVYNFLDYRFWDRARHRPRDLKGEIGVPPEAFVYLYFGRPGVSKGIEYLLDATGEIRRQVPGSHLVLLLTRDPADQYRRLLAQIGAQGLADHVTVLDPVARAELPGYLLAADCVVVPSVSEGFGFAALEAATLGCRVVATSGHAVEEVLGDSAVLVPPRDAAALAAAVVAAARQRAAPVLPRRRYDGEAHVEGMIAVYEGVASFSRSPLASANRIRPARAAGSRLNPAEVP
jgi:glycosyltransferase involved in cell wall biosynthesis